MNIDNSKYAKFRFCPWAYFEAYERDGTGVEQIPPPGEVYSSLEFGARMHELLQEHHTGNLIYPESSNEVLEMEAQVMIAAYKAKYPQEEFEIVDVERPFIVQLPDFCPQCYRQDNYPSESWSDSVYCNYCDGPPFEKGRHNLVGKIDLAFKVAGVLNIMDHKTEKRGAKSNLPQKWGAKDQASLYLWAASRIYPELWDPNQSRFYVNVLTRQSDKGQVGPTFPERMPLERCQRELDCAIRDIVMVADDIERYKQIFGDKEWPANRENCYSFYPCEYSSLHRYGEDVSEILKYRFKSREEYLHLDGIPIIQ